MSDFPSLEFKITALRDAGLYDIMFRNAGVGCLFYEGPRDDDGFAVTGEWKRHLVVNKYYPTFSQAIDAEYNARLTTKA